MLGEIDRLVDHSVGQGRFFFWVAEDIHVQLKASFTLANITSFNVKAKPKPLMQVSRNLRPQPPSVSSNFRQLTQNFF